MKKMKIQIAKELTLKYETSLSFHGGVVVAYYDMCEKV